MRYHAMLLLIAIACSASAAKQPPDTRHPDFVRQIATKARMSKLMDRVELYQSEHAGKPPRALLDLSEPSAPVKREDVLDAWGRPLYYYATEKGYVLASFGKSGVPRPQTARLGIVAQSTGYDVNLVVVDGEWAQLPQNVDY